MWRMTNLNKPRIAVLFPGALGDFVCLIPTLHALAKNAQLEVFAKTEFADIVSRDIPVGTLERYEINRLFVAGGAFERRVRDFFSPYERIYSWTGSGLPVFAGELGTVAPGRARLFAFRGANSTTHQADYYLSCLGFPQNHCGAVNIPLRPEALKWREEFWDRYALKQKAVLVLAPGSGTREKNWPAAYYAAIARWWRGRTGGAVIVLLGPAEQERGGLDALAVDFISAKNLNLAQVAALLCRGDLYLGNDSGITHLAAAVGAPTVALFGPSDARRWAPRGPKVRLLSLDVACSPCDLDVMKSCPHRKCLTEFLPEKVIGALEDWAEITTLTWGGAGIRVQCGIRPDQTKENAG
jgi:ADP-heptose:LPS heptosyltransferase